VMDLMQKSLGDDRFGLAHNKIQGQIRHRREERCKRRKMDRVKDPKMAAKRKRDKSQKQQKARKRQKAVLRAAKQGQLPLAIGRKKKAKKKL